MLFCLVGKRIESNRIESNQSIRIDRSENMYVKLLLVRGSLKSMRVKVIYTSIYIKRGESTIQCIVIDHRSELGVVL
jgi:hypothetical protein